MNTTDTAAVPSWRRSGSRRRIALLFLVLIPTITSSYTMARLLPERASLVLDALLVAVFGILFAWISVGFWAFMGGLFVLLTKRDRYRVSKSCDGRDLSIPDANARTAILIPIYNEEVNRVFAGVRTVYRSLKQTGALDRFDIFLLSDSTSPDVWVEEEEAWHDFRREEEGTEAHVFYRKRDNNIKRKSGNVADFCRRWGKNYRYMIVFDADSVMTGESMVRLVQIMEDRSDIGIIQTLPLAVNRETLIARVQQFANHVQGPLLAAGLHFWQLGDAQYCGHNAILRVEPFMKHCQLPRLPGKGALSGDILSHDFVESALMCRAGYGIWLAYDIEGSYEETPPTLLDELKRDRRWCQGNLQHMRLIFTRGFFPAHRALFLNGVLTYGSALLWLTFLIVNSAQAVSEALFEPIYMPILRKFLPSMPVWRPHWALSLLGSTALLLFLPKVLSALPILVKDFRARAYGGPIRLYISVFLEVVLSMILTPIRMIFHSLFIVSTLLGKSIGWGTQSRDDRGTTWREAFAAHWWGTLLGIAWGGVVYWIIPSFFWWISPMIFSFVLSIPISVFTGRASVGRFFRKIGLFLVPSEVRLPPILQDLEDNLERPARYSPFGHSRKQGFLRAAVAPRTHALHIAMQLPRRKKKPSPLREEARKRIVEKALQLGPDALSAKEKMALLRNTDRLRELHRRIWTLEDEEKAALWGLALPKEE